MSTVWNISSVEATSIMGAPPQQPLVFSICTLVNDTVQYTTAVNSFIAKGFGSHNAEFLFVDNTKGNTLDGYSGIREFVLEAKGQYVVVCHQDVELIEDGYDVLLARLRELDTATPNWALAGNAGLRGISKWAMRITDPHFRNASIGKLPYRVDSLDENFLVIKKSALVVPSPDLRGFDFYGLDLCLQAYMRGYSAYVIDFHVLHKGGGKKTVRYFAALDALEKKYASISRGRIARTPCEFVFLGWMYKLRFVRLFRWPLRRIFWLIEQVSSWEALGRWTRRPWQDPTRR